MYTKITKIEPISGWHAFLKKGRGFINSTRGYHKFGLKRCARLQRKKVMKRRGEIYSRLQTYRAKTSGRADSAPPPAFLGLKDLFNANACWLVLIYDTLIIPYVAKRISKYVSYIFYNNFSVIFSPACLETPTKKASKPRFCQWPHLSNHCLITNAIDKRYWNAPSPKMGIFLQ